MSGTDDRADETLPVTAEVGDEGGSYADPANQAATFSGPAGHRRVDAEQVAPASPGTVAEGVAPENRPDQDVTGEVRPASEPPEG